MRAPYVAQHLHEARERCCDLSAGLAAQFSLRMGTWHFKQSFISLQTSLMSIKGSRYSCYVHAEVMWSQPFQSESFQQRLCLHSTHTVRRNRISALLKMKQQDKSLYAGPLPGPSLCFCCYPKSVLQPCSRAESGVTGFWDRRDSCCCCFLLQLREAEWGGHTDRLTGVSNPLWQQTPLYLSGVQRMKLLLSLAFCLQSRTKGRRKKKTQRLLLSSIIKPLPK